MVIRAQALRGRRGSITFEILAAIIILGVLLGTVASALLSENRALLSHYRHAVAMEIVDGEMEILRAGAFKIWPEGEHTYPVRAEAARNLPQGRFLLTRRGRRIRLEWVPTHPRAARRVVREAVAP